MPSGEWIDSIAVLFLSITHQGFNPLPRRGRIEVRVPEIHITPHPSPLPQEERNSHSHLELTKPQPEKQCKIPAPQKNVFACQQPACASDGRARAARLYRSE